MIETILDFVYPYHCGICKKVCKECLCRKCEIKLEKYKLNNIIDCRYSKDKHFDYLLSIFKYEDIIRKKVIAYKFGDKPEIYKFFSKIILKNDKNFGLFKSNYDIIIPVPIHKNKKYERGYNQTELIAKEIAKCSMNLEYGYKILIKTKNTKTQSLLSKTERKLNIKDAFSINDRYKEKIANKKVILFDDIYTTGSTVNECSKILKRNGAKEVLVLTIAKD